MNAISKRLVVCAIGGAVIAQSQAAQPVLQRGYDSNVSGSTLHETILNATNVNPNAFGLVMKLAVDDNVFAQPLYVPDVEIANLGRHNVLYVATMSDTVYAFDADAGTPLWSVNLASLVDATPILIANFAFSGNRNIIGNLGILSTPVIDPSTHIMYVVAATLEHGTMAYRLHAIDITNGSEPYGPGAPIPGSYGGSTFDARYQTQRVSLVLSGEQVVFGFGALELEYAGGYVGWVMAFNKTTLQPSGTFATIAAGSRGGGVWQSGRPPVVDTAGYVYTFVGNGYSSGYDGVGNFNESALKLDPANGLQLVDWFTPGNWAYLDAKDLDFTSSGPLMIPGTTLLAGGGKTGDLYVLESTNLGKYNATDAQVVQKENITSGREIRGGPVYWRRSWANGGPLLYDWGANDVLRAYPFRENRLAADPSAVGADSALWPGGILTLSADGEQSGSGVLWATIATNGDAENNPPVPGELVAFNAEDVGQQLWNSSMNAARDDYGNYAKFVPPLVANGKVYVATWSNQVAVYGLLTAYSAAPTALPFGTQAENTSSARQSVTVTNIGGLPLPLYDITLAGSHPAQYSQTNDCGSSLPVAASCTVSVTFTPTMRGPLAATLKIGAGRAGTQTVALSGTGTRR